MTSAMSRTASGRWRAMNMMSTAPTNGAHVMMDSTGNGITRSPQAPLRQHEEQQHAEAPRRRRSPAAGPVCMRREPVARPQRPRAQHVEHAVHQVAVDPADQPREGEQDPPVEAGEERVEAVAAARQGVDRRTARRRPGPDRSRRAGTSPRPARCRAPASASESAGSQPGPSCRASPTNAMRNPMRQREGGQQPAHAVHQPRHVRRVGVTIGCARAKKARKTTRNM